MSSFPLVIVNYNLLTFLRGFLDQVEHLFREIIIIDNASSFPPLWEFYRELENNKNHGVSFTIHRLPQNYGHKVYEQRPDLLPHKYFLSDPDLQFCSKLSPVDLDVMAGLSERFQAYKVGSALDLSDSHLFIPGPYRESVMKNERMYYTCPIENDMGLELYHADIDTTFCFVNCDYRSGCHMRIRIAGRYTAKHLPWYHGYLKDNIPKEELRFWLQNNISSSILIYLSPTELGIEE